MRHKRRTAALSGNGRAMVNLYLSDAVKSFKAAGAGLFHGALFLRREKL